MDEPTSPPRAEHKPREPCEFEKEFVIEESELEKKYEEHFKPHAIPE